MHVARFVSISFMGKTSLALTLQMDLTHFIRIG